MERRAGTKGNADRQSTHWTHRQARVSKTLERMRHLFAVWTRGGSRMRESRTYGSVRGARDETRVPTATAPRVHRAARRRGGVAARGARAAGGDAGSRLPQQHVIRSLCALYGRITRGEARGAEANFQIRRGLR